MPALHFSMVSNGLKQALLILLIQFALPDFLIAQSTAESRPAETNVFGREYPRILPDNSILFRIHAPEAKKLQISMGRSMYEMEQDTGGYWTLKTDPKSPGLHFYSLVINGVPFPDPASRTFFEGNKYASGIEIPEKDVDFYNLKDVPHGDVRTHWYFSEQTGTWRRLFIYTPPGYGENPGQMYPVIYINHGAGEDESAWRYQGKADLILDNLIAEGKAVPMLVVMANEYIVDDIGDGYNSESTNHFFDLYKDELINDIIPFIEDNYRAISDPDARAIAGLSMGGGISFRIGMRNTETFGWVGVFSTSMFRGENGEIFDAEKQAPGILTEPEKFNEALNLLFISNGEQDPSFDYTFRSVEAFRAAGLEVESATYQGVHEWKVWRKALRDFAQRLFH